MVINKKTGAIIGGTLISMFFVHMVSPIAQDPSYHLFADQRSIFEIPNFWNVISNLPLILLGLLGFTCVALNRTPGYLDELKPVYLVIFASVFFTGMTSAYYHLNPTNLTLVWDRLCLAALIMSLFSSVWGEHISVLMGRKILWPLVCAGMAAVIYWHVTESQGRGDLRFYGAVQFIPMVMLPVILLFRRSRLTGVGYIWGLILAYVLAKTAEVMDVPIYRISGGFSGHEIKHWVAGIGIFIYYLAGFRRKTRSS